eukprot:SM000020S06091  [mRNA]  locus=s20:885502:889028:- [translate_table: standard]
MPPPRQREVATVPKEALGLPPKIVVATSDLYLRRLLGAPEEDLPSKAESLLVLFVDDQRLDDMDQLVSKFPSQHFTVMLCHSDGRMDDWLEYDWAQRATHVVAEGQTKWWFTKRFLHPSIVDAYDYVWLWDQTVGSDNFEPLRQAGHRLSGALQLNLLVGLTQRALALLKLSQVALYLELVKAHGLEISQPAVEYPADKPRPWQMTRRLPDSEVHKIVKENPGWCKKPHDPPCSGFVEMQNDLVHGWGLDFNIHKCAQGLPHKTIGVVDAQYVVLKPVTIKPERDDKANIWGEIESRQKYEWSLFTERMAAAVAEAKKLEPEPRARIILT